MKILIGHVGPIEVIGEVRCGGVVEKPKKKLPDVNLLNMRLKMMKKKKKKKIRRINTE
jgi:hypothetical protein